MRLRRCDDGGAGDAGIADGGADGAAATPCGDAACDRATEICVRREFGAGMVHECAPLPDGCAGERSCSACAAVCEEPADTCAETDEDNTLSCACLECRAVPDPAPRSGQGRS